tara:strand:+ start:871 stop:1755 length:885 start_codon:yes stop_codon:yes gene_type:complete
MIIKIDYRENKLIELCLSLINDNSNSNITLIQENLPLADIILSTDDYKEIIYIERKSLNDLASSIKDGRYKEQSFRLNESNIHNHNIIYLIEGNLNTYKNKYKISNNTLLSAMISLNLFKGFSIFTTNSLNETAEYILHLSNKLHKELYNNNNKLYFNNIQKQIQIKNKNQEIENQRIENQEIENQQIENQEIENQQIENQQIQKKHYVDVIKKTKKEYINKDNISCIMLSQIPGVSTNIAKIIMDKYKSMSLLIFELKNNPNILHSLKINVKNDKQRKISKTACDNIYNYLIH